MVSRTQRLEARHRSGNIVKTSKSLAGLFVLNFTIAVLLLVALATGAGAQSGPQVPPDFLSRHKPPVILAVDGFGPAAELGLVDSWAGYLAQALKASPNFHRLGGDVTAFAWSGDTKDSVSAVAALTTTYVPALAGRAVREGRLLVLVAHSWGGVLAYRALHELDETRRLEPNRLVLITLGTPLNAQNVALRSYARVFPQSDPLAHVFSHISKPESASSWTNYWTSHDNISGSISAASNVQLPGSAGHDHRSYYARAEFLDMIGAEIATLVAKHEKGMVVEQRPTSFAWKQYFPLSPINGEWTYSQSLISPGKMTGRYTLVTRYEGNASFEGRDTHRFSLVVRRTSPDTSEVTRHVHYLMQSEEGFMLVGREVSSSSGTTVDRYQPPLLFLGDRSKPGVAIESTRQPLETTGKLKLYTVRLTVVGFEEVTVPAGRFDALKITLDSIANNETQWLAPGIGMVRREIRYPPGFRAVAELVRHPGSSIGSPSTESPGPMSPATTGPTAQAPPQAQPVKRVLDQVLVKHRAKSVIHCETLMKNPFAVEGEIVAVPVRLNSMVDRNTGLFDDGAINHCGVVVSAIPDRALAGASQYFLIIGKVMGSKQLRLPRVAPSIPHLSFTGVHPCSEDDPPHAYLQDRRYCRPLLYEGLFIR